MGVQQMLRDKAELNSHSSRERAMVNTQGKRGSRRKYYTHTHKRARVRILKLVHYPLQPLTVMSKTARKHVFSARARCCVVKTNCDETASGERCLFAKKAKCVNIW